MSEKQILYQISLFLLILSGTGKLLHAQDSLLQGEERVNSLFEQLTKNVGDEEVLQLSANISRELETLLLYKDSFTYPFDSLKYLGKVTSPDQAFRLYCWNIVKQDGSYRYFACIQRSLDTGGYAVEKLRDREEKSENYPTWVAKSEDWPGALYYQIIPFLHGKQKLYLLLGWDGNNPHTNRKLIEVLHFDENGEAIFGAPVILWRGEQVNRVVFEYAKQARMMLRYEAPIKQVVFDHLSPALPHYKGQYEYYGPDFSYDALILENGIWKLEEDVDVRLFQQEDN